MDFFGFHPLYVVILLALALIIFGPSRLPKMGAQMGRMLREFNAAREGLTQQMRDAFEENEDSDTDTDSSSTFDTDEAPTYAADETETEATAEGAETSGEGAVAVLDPPAEADAVETEPVETESTEAPAAEMETAEPETSAEDVAAPEAAAPASEPEPVPVEVTPDGGIAAAEAAAAHDVPGTVPEGPKPE